MVASLPRPPKVENTKGVKEAESTLRTWSRFFSSSCLRNKDPTWVWRLLGALGWITLISKNAPCHLPQKPLAWISALAPSLQLADAVIRASPVSGCKGGSTTTSWHTSWSQLAVKFLSSLWRMKVKPPWRQIIAWSALNEAPQTQWLGLIPTHTSIVKHLKFLFIVYSNKNPAPEWEEQSAKVKDIWHWACQ